MKIKNIILAVVLALTAFPVFAAPARIINVSVASESPRRRPFLAGDYRQVISVYSVNNPGSQASQLTYLGIEAKGVANLYVEVGGVFYLASSRGDDWFNVTLDFDIIPGKEPRIVLHGDIAGNATEVYARIYSFGGEYDQGMLPQTLSVAHTAFETLPERGITNVSVRTMVTPNTFTVLGLVVRGDKGHSYPVLIRGIGATLKRMGVQGALADPLLNVYDSFGNPIAVNDRAVGLDFEYALVGAFGSLEKEDAATVVWLQPGAYTVQIKGFGTGAGDALIEAYQLPDSYGH